MKKKSLLALLFLSSLKALTCEQDNFLPRNNLFIPLSLLNGGLREDQFHEAIDRVLLHYQADVYERGAEVIIARRWEDGTVNAGTYRDGNKWIINIYGGFARHPYITQDGFTLVLCHELGHHLGGSPKKFSPSWSSAEGQADYFANLKCLRRIFENDDNAKLIKRMDVPSMVRNECAQSYQSKHDRALCIRTSMAGLSVAQVMANSQRLSTMPSFERPDLSIASQTQIEHPAVQCRLDTYFQGSLCSVPVSIPLSDFDPAPGACHSYWNDWRGLRPACWFRQ